VAFIPQIIIASECRWKVGSATRLFDLQYTLGIYGPPVVVRPVTFGPAVEENGYPVIGQFRRGTRLNVISIQYDLEPELANEMLMHELVHAQQVEHGSDLEPDIPYKDRKVEKEAYARQGELASKHTLIIARSVPIIGKMAFTA
jgi:hypothetical protein